MKFVRKIMIQDEEVKVYHIWKPDWFSIGIWTVIIVGTILIVFKVVVPIVSFLR